MILSWTVIGYIFHMWRTLYANLIGRIAFFTGENIAHIEFYLQGLLPKILAIYTIKRFLIPSRLASTCISFPVHVDYLSKSRSGVQSFDSFKANEIELNVPNLELASLCGSFSKEKYYRMENFRENFREN